MSGEKLLPGSWEHRIAGRPTVRLYEVVGKTGVVVWATWWDGKLGKKGAQRTKSTGMSIRFPEGHRRAGDISPALEQQVLRIAALWHADLVKGLAAGTTDEHTDRPPRAEAESLTLTEGFTEYLDPYTGRYPDPADPARGDIQRVAEEAYAALGKDTTFASLVSIAAAQKLWRHVQQRFANAPQSAPAKQAGHERSNRHRTPSAPAAKTNGGVWAERTVQHFYACVDWLTARALLPPGTCQRPSNWKAEFKADWLKLTGRDLDEEKEPPRFSTEEAGRLLNRLYDDGVDPRLRTNILCGGDALRSGQVRRAMRSNLDLSTIGEFGLGRLVVRGRGKKKGGTIDIDAALRGHLDREMSVGHLRECEEAYRAGAIADYALMPQGRFVDGATPVRNDRKYTEPVGRRTLLDYFHYLERIAGVEHVEKRAWYGLRRLWTDITPDHVETSRGRELMGGWTRGSKVPEEVYQRKENERATREASRARTHIREMLRSGHVAEVEALRTALTQAISRESDVELLQRLLEVLRAPDQTTEDEK